MKRIIINITLASCVTLVAYVLLGFLWGALLSCIQNPSIKLILIAVLTSAADAGFLLYFCKIKMGIGEEEVLRDYRDSQYQSLKGDMIRVIRSELSTLKVIWGIIAGCYLLNQIDSILFEKKILSLPTFVYTPMTIFGTCFDVQFIGYLVSAVVLPIFYLTFLALYRKRRYDYWNKRNSG